MADDERRFKEIELLRARGVHLVRCAADKRALDPGWQDTPWDGQGHHHLLAHVPGRVGLAVIDVDQPKGLPAGGDGVGWRRQCVIEAMGGMGPALELGTLSGGVHLYYAVDGPGVVPNWKLTVGDLRGDNGYAILWGEGRARLAELLDESVAPMPRAEFLQCVSALRAGGSVVAMVPRRGRGRVEGDRNCGLYAKCVAALANDLDPEPAITDAVRAAKEAGLPFAEIDRTVASARGSRAAGEVTRDPIEGLEEFLPDVDDAWRPAPDGMPSIAERSVHRYQGLEPKPGEHVEGQDDVADHLAVQWGNDLRYVWPRLPGARFDPSPFMRWTLDGWMSAATLRGNVVRWTGHHLTTLVWSNRKGKLVRRPLKKEGKSSEFATGCMKLLAMRTPVGTWAGEWDAEPHLLAIDATRAIDLLRGQVVETAGRPLRRRRIACEPDPHWREGKLLEYLARRLPDEAVRERQMLEWAAACFGVRLSKRSAFAVGPSGTWKTSYQSVLRRALGDGLPFPYGGKLPSAYLVSGARTTEHKLDSALAELQGCRVAFFDETPTDRNGNAAPWSPAFVGDITSDMDGITYRRLGKDAGTAHGVTILGACNMLPTLPKVDAVVGAILARLLPIPWTVGGADRAERMFLGSKAAMAQMLGLAMEYGPKAASMPDDAPVPSACREALAAYAAAREPRA